MGFMLPHPYDLLPSSASAVRMMRGGTVLFRRSDPATAMFFLRAGRVDLVRYTDNGDAVVIHRAGPGESFAEAAIFSEFYHCDALATEQSEVVKIAKAAVQDMIRTNPDFALAISAHFASQIQNFRRRLEILAIRSAMDRVFTAVAEGLLSGDVKGFAAQIGLSHEAVYRALSALARSGKLQKTGRGAYKLP